MRLGCVFGGGGIVGGKVDGREVNVMQYLALIICLGGLVAFIVGDKFAKPYPKIVEIGLVCFAVGLAAILWFGKW